MISIVTEYSLWLGILCIALGVLYSYVLYHKGVKYQGLPKYTKYVMIAARFLTITFLSFLLLSPLIKTLLRTVEKPIIVVAQDNSSSLTYQSDSAYLKGKYRQDINRVIEELSDKYEVRKYLFGEKISENKEPDYTEKATNITTLFDELEDRYVNRNLGAVILGTDGLYNQGENPLYKSKSLKCPIYTIAMGDTVVKRDLILAKINHNKTVYTGNSYPLEIMVQAKMLRGQNANLVIEKDDKTVFEQTINITSDNFSKNIPVQLKAEGKETIHLTAKLIPLKEEITIANNVQHVFIEVINNKQKVLILADAPHPDIAALRESIEKNENYEVEYSLINDFHKNTDAYHLVVLHQLPSVSVPNHKIFSDLQKSDVSRLFIVGNNSNFNALNTMQSLVNISGVRPKFNEALPSLNSGFSLFNLIDNTKQIINSFAPLLTPFGNLKTSAGAAALFNQQLGTVATNNPLIAFNEINNVKTGIIFGEGLWRWRINNYQKVQNHDAFNEIMGKIVQYMSVKTDKSLFRISHQNSFNEGEQINFDAHLYNESYEEITEPDIKIDITNEHGKTFSFQFSKNDNGYYLNIPSLPVGYYKYVAQTQSSSKTHKMQGSFVIKQVNVEALNTTANHQLLHNIAQKTGGQMVFPSQLNQLEKLLNEQENIVPVSYTEEKLQNLISLRWIFFILLAFLSVEWFLRKRYGGY
ncbi:MAG: hypothetical protein IT238_03290 [Bacteroidia bacterium]|nr:hypothetical protein [Bacteroidia bacterium]MCZ2249065.1 hypothetical protein [Bacteroidia bacterium]